MSRSRRLHAGFTLVEVLIVIVILALLSILIWNQVVPYFQRLPREAEATTNLRNICIGAQMYRNTPKYDGMGNLLPPQFPTNQTMTPAAGFCETTHGGLCPASAWPGPWAAFNNFSPGGTFYNSYGFSTAGTAPNQYGVAWATMRYGTTTLNLCTYCYANGTIAGPSICPLGVTPP